MAQPRKIYNTRRGGQNADLGPAYSEAKDDVDDGVFGQPPSISVSNVDLDMVDDEIVHGTRNETTAANGDTSSPLQVTSDKKGVGMVEAGGEIPVSHYSKRKRALIYDNLDEDQLGAGLAAAIEDASIATRQARQVPPADYYRQSGCAARIDPLEHTNSLARCEVHKLEAAHMRQDRVLSQCGLSNVPGHTPLPTIVPSDSRAMLQENMARLNRVWRHQETARHYGQQQQAQQEQQEQTRAHAQAAAVQAQAQAQTRVVRMTPQQEPTPLPSQLVALATNMEEVRVLGNVTYSRKQTGPFAGKLVSRGELVTIDGEDCVEYRVLTKPTFL